MHKKWSTVTYTLTHTQSHLQTSRQRHLASVWAEIILDQYNSVSEPKHKLGSCWKTLLHMSSCLCMCVCVRTHVSVWGLPDGNEPHWPRPSLPLVFLSFAVLIGNGCKSVTNYDFGLSLFHPRRRLPIFLRLVLPRRCVHFLLFLTLKWWCYGFSSLTSFFFLFLFSNRVSPHQNSQVTSFNGSTPVGLSFCKLKVRMSKWGCKEPCISFRYPKKNMEASQVKWVLDSIVLQSSWTGDLGYIRVVYGVMLDWVGLLNIIRASWRHWPDVWETQNVPLMCRCHATQLTANIYQHKSHTSGKAKVI